MYCLSLDVGERRTGIALGERLARPLMTLKRRSKVEDFDAIGRLVREHHVDTVVVGLPLNMDGSKGFQAAKVERYALLLRDALAEMGLPIELVLWDERMTTEEAESRMVESGVRQSDRQQRIDAVAAAVILQSYLDYQAGPMSGERLNDTES